MTEHPYPWSLYPVGERSPSRVVDANGKEVAWCSSPAAARKIVEFAHTEQIVSERALGSEGRRLPVFHGSDS